MDNRQAWTGFPVTNLKFEHARSRYLRGLAGLSGDIGCPSVKHRKRYTRKENAMVCNLKLSS